MTDEQIIKAIAELDGWTDIIPSYWDGLPAGTPPDWSGSRYQTLKPYLTSYDAIIPVIQKQDEKTTTDFILRVYDPFTYFLDFTPAQLCEALLRATGKWVEE